MKKMSSQSKKTRSEILTQSFVNVSDIAKLFGQSYSKAKKVYEIASAEYDQEVGPYRIEETRVPIKKVMKINHIDFNLLKKQIELEESMKTKKMSALQSTQ